jgi:hypothetical protein
MQFYFNRTLRRVVWRKFLELPSRLAEWVFIAFVVGFDAVTGCRNPHERYHNPMAGYLSQLFPVVELGSTIPDNGNQG